MNKAKLKPKEINSAPGRDPYIAQSGLEKISEDVQEPT